MSQHKDPNHTLFFALAAFGLLVMLGSESNLQGLNSAAVSESLFGKISTVSAPVVAAGQMGEWSATGTTDFAAAVNEDVCDGNQTFISPRTYTNSEASLLVSLQNVPNGSKITGLTLTPCVGSFGGVASSDVVFSYSFPGYKYLAQPVGGRSGSYVFGSGLYTVPTVQKSTVFNVPSIEKNANTQLLLGVAAERNGGGVRVSNMKVSVDYIAPQDPTSPSVPKPDFSGTIENTADTASHLFTDVVLTWSEAVGKKGGQIEVLRQNAAGEALGAWEMVGVLSASTNTFRYPLVIGGIPREDYFSGITYVFRIRFADGQQMVPSYSEKVSIHAPEGLQTPEPTQLAVTQNKAANRIELTWTDNFATDYSHWFAIERAVIGNTLLWQEIGRTSSIETSFNDLGPFVPGNYFYRIRAVRQGGAAGQLLSPYSEIRGTIWQ